MTNIRIVKIEFIQDRPPKFFRREEVLSNIRYARKNREETIQ